MAPPRLYERPHEQLGRLMAAARRRGLSFDEAWDEAVRPGRSLVMSNTRSAPDGALRWPTDRADRLAWQYAIKDAREGWQRAYERMATSRAEAALAYLGDELLALDRALSRGIGSDPAVLSAA